MTKEEILAMEAGVKLDELIAEGVMEYEKPNFFPPDALDLCLAGDAFHIPGWTCICLYDEGDIPKWVPDSYSTDISAAWPVAVKMGLALFPLNNKDWACCKANYVYSIKITQDHYADPNLIICREAPEAICKAALIAKIDK